MKNIYVLSDSPTKANRENVEAIVKSQTLVHYLDRNAFLQRLSTSQLNKQLLSLFRRYNPRYLPIEGREHLQISKKHPEINELIGLHKIVYQHAVYEHTPVYLRKETINDTNN